MFERTKHFSTVLSLFCASALEFCVSIVERCGPLFFTGINQFNHMALPNAQISQAPMGARAASPMNHPQQMNMSSVPAVRPGQKMTVHTHVDTDRRTQACK